MANEGKQSRTEPEQDDSFEALLRKAARVSAAPASARAVLPAGATLSGGRLSVLRRVGEGGMGVVYEVFDNERKARLALKTLSRLDAGNVYRLKNEFRALADVTHPNLVRLHELFSDEDTWFFTMELVEGERFDRWVRPQGSAREGRAQEGEIDEARLRAALPQLVAAVSAIHGAGKLHRDLKPSNVLVTSDGRVVVLDFGLAVDPELGGVGQTVADDSVSGTPAYMAPEQAAGKAASAASDFYALGVMLFEALTGRLPFEGRTGEMLAAKQTRDSPRASEVTPGVPPDLDELCARLLSREQIARPDAVALRDNPGVGDGIAASSSTPRPSVAPDAPLELLGREAELAALREAYEATVAGKPVALFVSGESGMGKSALLDAFISGLRAEGRAVVLSGRCYERENVPYKGFDALIDELSRYLRKLPREDAAALLPREVFALVRLFPVLDRVPVVAEAPKKEIPDPHELQSRAFAALRELLWAIRDRRPLVMYIDDLQWVDRDTTVLLAYLLAQRDTMPALAIGSHRVEGAEQNALLQAIRAGARDNRAVETRELNIGPLSKEAACALATRSLGARADVESLAASVSHEAQGSPFFVGELARFARRQGAAGWREISLEQALVDHVAQLPKAARSLLELLALVGQPLASSVVVQAAAVQDGHAALDLLRSEQLVRGSVDNAGVRRVECYHDRVRESVSSALSPLRRTELYAALARTLEAREDADPELLATCYEGAGAREPAACAAELAGDRAVAALAFERAARLYEGALGLGTFDEPALRALRIKRADALVGAGRGTEGAREYREAAINADADLALELKRKAAHQLMVAGHDDEGRELLAEVLAAIGVGLPSSRSAALARVLISRARLRLRGLALSERGDAPLSLSGENTRRLESLWVATQGFSANDPLLMVDMGARHLRLALDAGSTLHAALGLAVEGAVASYEGADAEARATALSERAMTLAERLGEPEVLAMVLTCNGAVLSHVGRFARSRQRLDQAIELLTTRCGGMAYLLPTARYWHQLARYCLGQFRAIAASAGLLVEDAIRRGDLWAATMLGSATAVAAWLTADDPGDVRARFEQTRCLYAPQSGRRTVDQNLLYSELFLLRYEGDPARAFERACLQWPVFAQDLRVQFIRVWALNERGASAVGALRQGCTNPAHARAIARGDSHRLMRTRQRYAPAFASLLEAGLAQVDGHSEHAVSHLRSAITNLDANEIAMYAAAARRRLGELLGGDEGRALLAQGDATMLAQGVKNLDQMTEMLVPGCRSR